MIAVIDFGAGNLKSVFHALETVGATPFILSRGGDLQGVSGVILPGVGAFGRAMANLKRRGLVEYLNECVTGNVPFLGICLGMQLLFDSSDESIAPGGEEHAGLGIFPGRVRRFPSGLKVPQIGWNRVEPCGEPLLLDGIPPGTYMYFVHSFYVEPRDPEIVAATTDYGLRFPSAVSSGHVHGVQFHPEKSSKDGLKVLANFVRLCEEVS